MKLNVTCADCEITVEEIDGKCVVQALKGGEVVEEFEVDCEAEENDDDIDIDEEDMEMDGEDMEMDEDEDVEVMETLSFSQFNKKRRK